ncbi:MAG: urate hydroxylase PuuD [Steroidobacteraceae bacterium]
MLTYLLDWAGLLLRWLHLIAGIAWIGASFYFVWLDNHLQPLDALEPADPNVAGELWAVHGGGFYRSRKYRIAPPVLPATLHWFYWEAYTTWLSGFLLLCLLYFWQAQAYLIDPAVLPLTKVAAVGIALAALPVSWLVYDALCRSPLGRSPRALAAVLATLIAVEAWGLTQMFSGRGAFMLFGAALGTIMVANVLFVIIPGQRELVLAKQQGREPDAGPGLKGKQRSIHNTYFTLPVLFVMISNHYAVTYGARRNWLVLIAMSFAGACIRAWFVARHKPGQRRGYAAAAPAVLGVLTLGALVIALAPPRNVRRSDARAAPPAVDVQRVQAILGERCVPCHAANPTQPGFSAPPNGIVLQNADQVRAHLPQIEQQLAMRAMPLGNLTGMTDDERAIVLMWIGHGAQP